MFWLLFQSLIDILHIWSTLQWLLSIHIVFSNFYFSFSFRTSEHLVCPAVGPSQPSQPSQPSHPLQIPVRFSLQKSAVGVTRLHLVRCYLRKVNISLKFKFIVNTVCFENVLTKCDTCLLWRPEISLFAWCKSRHAGGPRHPKWLWEAG